MSIDTASGPRLKAGSAVSTAQGKLTFLGGHGSREISGADAFAVVLPVVRLLDGTRDWDRIAVETGLTPAKVSRVGDFLRAHGLIEEGTARQAVTPLRDFLATWREVPAEDEDTVAAADRLAQASVVVLAPGPIARRLSADLLACGLGSATIPDAAAPVPGGHTLALVSRDTPDSDTVVQALRAQGTTVLTFAAGRDWIEIGPSFGPASGVCHRCFRIARSRRLGEQQPSGAADPDLLAGLVGHEALALLTEHTEPATYNAVVRYRLPLFERERYLLAAEPDCPDCPAAPSALVAAFEQSVRYHGSGQPVPVPASNQAVRQKMLVALVDARPEYPFHPKPALPAAKAAAGPHSMQSAPLASPEPPHGLSPETVGTLLRMVAGRRESPDGAGRNRWVASGGNLGSVELFAICAHDLLGHPAGTVFRYDDIGHRLIVTRTTPAPVPATGDLSLVLVANTGRLAAKYSEFGLRLAYLDAGCALAQLRHVAARLGLELDLNAPGGPSARELELLPGAELITAHAILRAAPPDRKP